MEVGSVLSKGPYYIAFYQRDYEWKEGEVNLLLDDIFGQLDKGYEKDSKDPEEAVKWITPYYLNTFITNIKEDGKKYLVDGQQRLTTLLLIYMVLRDIYPKIKKIVDTEIIRDKPDEGGRIFSIQHDKPDSVPLEGEKLLPHQQTLQDLLDTRADRADNLKLRGKAEERDKTGETSQSMVNNYVTIRDYLRRKFKKGGEDLDEHYLETFFYYYRTRVSLTQLKVEFDDSPMIFEAVNDRGKKVPAYEILKGKLLGRLDPEEVYDYLDIWEACIERIKECTEPTKDTEEEEAPDKFFKRLFTGRYIKTKARYDERVPNKVYHREFLFKADPNGKNEKKDGLITSPEKIKDFLEKNLVFYTGLFKHVESSKQDYPFFPWDKKTGDLPDSCWSLLFGAIHSRKYDPDVFDQKDSKDLEDIRMRIRTLSFERKRLETLRKVQRINIDTDSTIYAITSSLREKKGEWVPGDVRELIDNKLKSTLEKSKQPDKHLLFSHDRFTVEDQLSFLRDVDIFLLAQTKLERGILIDPSKGQDKWEIEHILANNDDEYNEEEFGDDFKVHREGLGAKVLLRKKPNSQASNKTYKSKLKYYDRTDRTNKGKKKKIDKKDEFKDSIWTATLAEKFHGPKVNKSLHAFKKRFRLDKDFKPYDEFGKKAISEREGVLRKIAKIMWADNTLDEKGYPQTAIYPGHPGSGQKPRDILI
ncbi:MAG: DUF262 domain-containing protein [Cytophagales bacterium]|nr:DUF262 domain-containing protein [Cytophagales bacterium]